MGKNCCIPGCTNYQIKTKKSDPPDRRLAAYRVDHNYSPTASATSAAVSRPISYVSFPRYGISTTQDEWRKKLILAVSRTDSNFNADTQHMCTCHFLEADLLFHGKSHFHPSAINMIKAVGYNDQQRRLVGRADACKRDNFITP